MFDFITLVDGYKLDHRRQYPAGTELVYSNWTPRSSRIPSETHAVFFGLQYLLQAYFTELAEQTFFKVRKQVILDKYQRRLDNYFGPNEIGTKHIADLHDLGHIPLAFKALPEGARVPLKCPMFTVESTHPDFFWVTNYFETMISNIIWKGCTSASTAYRLRKLLDKHAIASGDFNFVDWQGHDFSYRGMSGTEDAAISGAGHLLSFTGTDTLPAIELLETYYHAGKSPLIGMSVPATEHSVMCAGGEGDEEETYTRLLKLYPNGIVSIVSDTWDLWNVVGNILPKLKDLIMSRNGKTVIRPDSGDPANILCGDVNHKGDSPRDDLIRMGLIEALWNLFGGTRVVGKEGVFKVLDSHIGAIYGDSINFDRADDICNRLRAKGFASTNVVFGFGSYNYEYTTRDTYGFAMKATAATVSGKEHMLFKDPKTDDGMKRSARGRMVVHKEPNGEYRHMDSFSIQGVADFGSNDQLKLVWKNGIFHRRTSLEMIRAEIRK